MMVQIHAASVRGKSAKEMNAETGIEATARKQLIQAQRLFDEASSLEQSAEDRRVVYFFDFVS